MAPTFRHGKGAHLSVVFGGTTYNLSSGVDDTTMERMADTAEVTTYGDNDRNYIAGLRDGSWSVAGTFASTYELISSHMGSTALGTVRFGPHGTTTGYPKFQASILLTQFNVGAPVDDKISMDLTFQRSGALTSTKY
jgi:hypothetical protein